MKLLHVIASALARTAGAASAAERRSLTGAALPARLIDSGAAFEAAVDAGGDEVLSVHAILRPASSNVQLMRDRDGFWTE